MATLETGLKKMQKNVVDAAQGSKTAQASLARLGVSIADLAGLSPDRQFELLADRLSQVRNPAIRTALAMDLFGKAGTRLLPLMSQGAAGIESLRDEARRLGLSISGDDAQAAEAFGDSLGSLWKVVKAGAFAIGAALVPVLGDLVTNTTAAAVSAIGWVKENKELVVIAFKIAAGIAAGGAALVAIGIAASAAGTILGVVASAIAGVGTAVGLLGSVLAAIFSPLGLVIAGVVALGAVFVTSTDAGAQALAWLGERFKGFKDTALATFGAIGDALAAGDLALAAKVLWLAIKMEWQRGVAFLQSTWVAFKGFFLQTWNEATTGLALLLSDAWAGLETAWVELTTFLANAWTRFTAGITSGWRTAQNFISKGILHLMSLFDESVDVEGASRVLDEDLARANNQANSETQAVLTGRETARQSRRGQIESDRQGRGDALGSALVAETQRLQSQNKAELDGSEAAFQEARKEWEAAVAQAAKRREEADAAAPAGAKPVAPKMPDIEANFAGAGELLGEVKQKFDVQGSFNAAAVRGLGAENASDRTAKATEQIATNTKRLLQEAQRGGLVFA